MKVGRPLVLASASPRRREILTTLGVPFEVVPSEVDESRVPHGGTPAEYAIRVATAKGADVYARIAARADAPVVLSADTVVALAGEIFGKPNDDEDARRMLGALAGREHTVVTAVAVFDGARGPRTVAVETAVVVDGLGAATIDGYIASGEGRDKAGAYAIQGLGGGFVRAIRGSYGNVVGLPASESLELLRGAGVVLEWP